MIRSEISRKNPYYISKYRYYELKYFCLQYPVWKKAYGSLCGLDIRAKDLSIFNSYIKSSDINDPTSKRAIAMEEYSKKIDLVERVVLETDEDLFDYILEGVTKGHSYDYLYTHYNIPCSRGTYYDRYRRFFWLLNKYRN